MSGHPAKAAGLSVCPPGGRRGSTLSFEAIAASRAAQTARAAERGADLAPIVAELRAEGATSLAALAEGLTRHGIPTARGGETWKPMQVARLLRTEGAFA